MCCDSSGGTRDWGVPLVPAGFPGARLAGCPAVDFFESPFLPNSVNSEVVRHGARRRGGP